MKTIRTIVLLSLIYTNSFAQNTIKLTYQNTNTISKENLSSLPKEIQEVALIQMQNSYTASYLFLQGDDVFFLKKKEESENNQKGKIASNGNTIFKDLSLTVNSPEIRIQKNSKTNTYTHNENNKLNSGNLSKVIWNITTNKKKILGFNCTEAIGKYSTKTVTVYFTKEIKAKGSPNTIPFIDGVVLEYSTDKQSGIATKIEYKQPAIKNFFKQ
ncbi:GLPGLI family protein [Flavobacterium sp. K5-23]|uniref:GLPGLI family protein n=1 Tax=Flavobacterium sp. K5-23 TaxID=2746225 RepID=UPI00200BC3B6|nr:GLPGLI family protein [Flavobacterium sp. K5-23]UQD55332.1 GLPGLI family protein [Flavobacterium sp. K5-23]